MARTMKEKALYIEEQKQRMYAQFLLKGYSPAEISELLANYPKLIAGLDCQPLPEWYREALVCRYNPSKQGVKNGVDIIAGQPWKLKDFSGNGLDMDMHGFLGAGMSGMGGYGCNIGKIRQNGTGYIEIIKNNYKEFTFKALQKIPHTAYWIIFNRQSYVTDNFRIKGGQYGWIVKDGTSSTSKILGEVSPNSVATISNATTERYIYFLPKLEIPQGAVVTIEQLPLYEGGLVFDGVDDYGVIKNKPKLNDYTVLTKRKILNFSTVYSDIASTAITNQKFGAFLFEHTNVVFSFGESTYIEKPISKDISWQTKNQYNGDDIHVGNVEDTNKLTIGTFLEDSGFSNFVLYDFLLFNRTLTPDEIDWVKYNIMGEELPKPIAVWDAKGRRNDEPEAVRSVLLDKTGNGHNIELKNFAFEGESGYGGYAFDMNKFKATDPSAYSVEYSYNSLKLNYIKSVGFPLLIFNGKIGTNFKLKCSSEIELNFDLREADATVFTISLKNGINDISIPQTLVYSAIRIKSNGIAHPIGTTITLELLPNYPNALVFDGVDDFGICENMPIFTKEKGYTIIAEREYYKEHGTTYVPCLLTKRKVDDMDGAFQFERNTQNNRMQTRSFGGKPTLFQVKYFKKEITWQISNSYNGIVPIEKGVGEDNIGLAINALGISGQIPGINGYLILYSLHIFDHDLTPTEIELYIQRNIDKNYTLPKVEQVNE